MSNELSPGLIVSAYAQGIFPMADEDGTVYWFSPDPRAIIELEGFHASRSLQRVYRQGRFKLTIDEDFSSVIDGCADRAEGTWISADIRRTFIELNRLGFAHSVEVWRDGRLAGGIYGIALGGAFFAESMFHRVSNASKVALYYLIQRLRKRGFILFDVQFTTPHLHRHGCTEIPRAEYFERLDAALHLQCRLTD